MAKRELIDIEDAITECRNSFDISEAVVNMRDWCHIITEQEIVKPYLDKIRAKFISLYPKNYAGGLELGGAGCVFSLNKVLEILDKYKVESEE